MKKHFLAITSLLLLLSPNFINAQNIISDKEWTGIIKLLQTEKWPAAEKITNRLLQKIKPGQDTSYDAANLRFMYLVSVAGQLAHKTIDKETALKKVDGLKGKVVVTPTREFKRKGLFNYFKANDDSTLYCCQSNNAATEIQVFETYQMKPPSVLAHSELLEGKQFRIRAVIKQVEAEGFSMPRLRVLFIDASFYNE